MQDFYWSILKDWEKNTALPVIYDRLDELFPEYTFRRIAANTSKDHWASPFKLDGSRPKYDNREKTVVYRSEMKFREQGEWEHPVGVIDLVMKREGFDSVYRAYCYLDGVLGLLMPKMDSASVSALSSAIGRKKDLLRFLQRAFASCLAEKDSRKAGSVRAYLKKRGFAEPAMRALGFGCVPEWNRVIKGVTDAGYSLAELDEVCGVRNAYGKTTVGTTHILSIPYIIEGEITGFIFRRINGDDGPKYIVNAGLNRKEKFFNAPKGSLAGQEVVIVEGEFDVLHAKAYGIDNVLSIGGSEIAGERISQVKDILDRGVTRITLFLDLDTGPDGLPNLRKRYVSTLRCIHSIKECELEYDNIYIVPLDEAGDPDSIIKEKGIDHFNALVEKAVPYWKFIENDG